MLPTVITGVELAKALGVTVEFLVYGRKEMKNDEGNNERKQAGDM